MRSDPAIVFVHGLFGPFNDLSVFGMLRPAVCSAPDLDGYGESAGGSVSFRGQIEALRQHIRARHPGARVHLVAHSIGAVYAFALADEFPGLVASVTTVEGNFTLADAFWSRSIAALDAQRARVEIQDRLDDPAALLAADGIALTPESLAKAKETLAYQPWRTVWESASAVVDITASPAYEAMLQRVFASHPVHLVAGERSIAGWDIPVWARSAAASVTVIPSVGHMMMLESPESFAQTIGDILKIA